MCSPGTRIVCALCGHDTLGNFYLVIPGDFEYAYHSMRCGPVLDGLAPIAEPTHERLPDGTFRRLS